MRGDSGGQATVSLSGASNAPDVPLGFTRRRAYARSPLTVGAVVLVLYGIWFAGAALAGYSAHDLINISKKYATYSHTSSVITYEPHTYRYTYNKTGYDGEFFYFIAVDPIHARYYVDDAPYRYTKILYPMLARLIALGYVDAVPYTLLLINWLAAALGTVFLAAWLRRQGTSPWFALAYGLYPGIFIGVQRDLTEPLSYALVAAAIYVFDLRSTRATVGAALLFGLAGLTRDKSIIFPALYATGLLFQGMRSAAGSDRIRRLAGNIPRAVMFLVIAVGPLGLWKLFLLHWLHQVTVTQEAGSVAPFAAVSMVSSMNASTVAAIPTVVLPGLICGAMAVWAIYRGEWDIKVWVLLLVVTFSVITLDPQFYRDLFSMLRVSAGVVLSAIFCLPTIDRVTRRRRTWFWIAVVCWFPIPMAFTLFAPAYLYMHTSP